MNPYPAIPPAYRTLIACLRGAVNGLPPDTDLASADWPAVFRQAREQGVDTYLYPWLAARVPGLFALRAPVGADSATAAWRDGFLAALPHSAQRHRQLDGLLAACAAARIDVVPLKGAWLSETVYDDPAQRSMADLDLLIRAEDRDACHALFRALGYAAESEALHNVYACDLAYRHPGHPLCVELHWHVEPEMAGGTPRPDIAAVWRNTSAGRLRGQPVRLFAPADQVSHLTQHILHHLFAVPLRGYLDIALYLKKAGALLTADAMDGAAARWKTGRATPFLLRLVAELFAIPLPAAVRQGAPDREAERNAQAFEALFNLPEAHARDGETTLLRFKHASVRGRTRLVLSRIFMPRAFLAMRYPCARHTCLLPYVWFRRACDLRRANRDKMRDVLSRGTPGAEPLANAERRANLVTWLLEQPPARG